MRDFSSMRMIIRKTETENLPCLPVHVFFILFSQPIVSNMGIFIDRWPALADLVASSLRHGTTNPPLLDARSLRRAHRPARQCNSSRLYQSSSNTTRRNISWDKIKKKKRKNKLQISGGHSCWFQLEALSIPTWRYAHRWNGIFIASITPLANNDKIDLFLALRCVTFAAIRLGRSITFSQVNIFHVAIRRLATIKRS